MNEPLNQLTGREAVEAFHIIVLDELAECLEHDLWSVKGGVNLRAFFDSIRFSEDIDLDVVPLKRQAIKTHLLRILKSQPFLRRLRSIGIQDILTGEKEISKDTETTLRLSRQLVVGGAPYSTTIEVSFREKTPGHERMLAPVIDRLAQRYVGSGRAVKAPHYVRRAALAQKLDALANRTAVQARDVFDICWLVRTDLSTVDRIWIANDVGADILRRAGERATEISYGEYSGQVLEYLEPADALPFTGEDAWQSLQLQVIALTDDLLER